MTEEVAVSLRNVSKTFYLSDQTDSSFQKVKSMLFQKLSTKKLEVFKNITVDIKKGEFFGIVGRNGSGKSTLLKLIMESMNSDPGSIIETNGKLIRLALGLGFDVNLTARDNIYLNGTILGMSMQQIGEKFDELIEFAQLEEFVDTPIKFYSSGMRSRLAFSVAVHADADIFLIDEFFGGVGDEAFKAKSKAVFEERIIQNKTIILVSHSLELIVKNCDRVMVIKDGVGHVFNNPANAIQFHKKSFGRKVTEINAK